MTTLKKVAGIDVGKEKLDVAIAGKKKVRTWSNDKPDREALGKWLSEQKVELVVMEASGGYEAGAASELVEQRLAVAVVNPTRVRAFATGAFQFWGEL